MKAIIKGETHTSKTDTDHFLELISGRADAVFQEGRPDRVEREDWTLLYLLFLMGAFFVYWVNATFSRGRTLEERVSLPFYDDIDWTLPEVYDQIPKYVIGTGAVVGAAASGIGLYTPYFPLPLISGYSAYWTILIKPVMVLGGPLLFSFSLIFYEASRMGGRDKKMAESVAKTAESNNYEIVAVLCGEAHKDGLAEELREQGWEVETYSANSPLPNPFWR